MGDAVTGRGRRLFVVDRVLPAVGGSEPQVAQRALDEAGRRPAAGGGWVCRVYSTYVPSRCRRLRLFAASSAQVAWPAYEIVQIPVCRVDEAVELPSGYRQPT